MSLQVIRFCFDWWIILRLTLKIITQGVRRYKWCQDIQKPCSIIFCLVRTTNHTYIAEDWLSFNWDLWKSCWFSAVYYWIWSEGYQVICVRSSLFAKRQQTFEIKPVNIKQVKITQDVNKKNICWYGTQ